jgi:iron complex outermembrane receptor protein
MAYFQRRKGTVSFVLIVVLLVLGHGVLRAEPIQLETIVVTAEKEDVGKKKTIETKSLRSHSIVDLAEVLSDEMVEATMIRKSGYGNEVSLRGFGKENLRVLIDDGILEGACGSRKDPSLSHVNLLTVEKVEVKQGPFDVRKSGALGGSINVITKNPQEGFHGEILPKAGSFDFYSGGFYVTGGNEKAQALAGYNYSESDQYKDGDGNKLTSFASPGRPYKEEAKDKKAFEKRDVWAKLQLTPGQNHTLLFSYAYGEAEDILTPRVGFDTESERTHLAKAEYNLTELGRLSERLAFSIYHNKIEHDPSNAFRELVAPGPPLKNDVESTITGGKVENLQVTGFASLTYGLEVLYRNWNGKMYRDDTGALFNPEMVPDVDVWGFGLYLQAEKEVGPWFFSAGFRGDSHETEADRALPNTTARLRTNKNKNADDMFSGYFSADFDVTDNVSVFGGLGRGVRFPTCVERYLQPPRGANFAGNPELEPTINTEFDLGFQVTHGPFRFRAKGFYSDLDDYIYQEGGGGLTQTWRNIDAHLYGVDAKATADLLDEVYVEAALAYQKGRKDSQTRNNSDKDLAEIPPLKSRLAFHYDASRIFAVLEWIHSEDNDDVDEQAGEVRLSGWDVCNLRAGYELSQHVTLNLGIDNLFDEYYAVANSYEWDVVAGTGANPPIVFEPGRSIYGSITMTW